MNCPRCNTPNPEGSVFCNKCGLRLPPPAQNQNHQKPQQNTKMNQYQYGNPNQAYQMNKPNTPPKTPLYKKTWFIVLMCIFLPPIGVVFLWLSKKPKNQAARILLTVFLCVWTVFLMIPTAQNSINEDSNPKTDVKENKEEKEDDSNKSEKEKTDEAKQEEQNNELMVGSSFENGGLKITVNEANLDYRDYSDEYGMYTPADGMRYVMVSFTFENGGNSDAYVSIYDFDCYADNTSCEQAYLPDDSDFINTNLSPGRNISFKTYYSVPVNATTIELEYETSIWTGEKAVIKLQ